MARGHLEMSPCWERSLDVDVGQVGKGLLCDAEMIRLHMEGDGQPPKCSNVT